MIIKTSKTTKCNRNFQTWKTLERVFNFIKNSFKYQNALTKYQHLKVKLFNILFILDKINYKFKLSLRHLTLYNWAFKS